jgi:hypothetical protein
MRPECGVWFRFNDRNYPREGSSERCETHRLVGVDELSPPGRMPALIPPILCRVYQDDLPQSVMCLARHFLIE